MEKLTYKKLCQSGKNVSYGVIYEGENFREIIAKYDLYLTKENSFRVVSSSSLNGDTLRLDFCRRRDALCFLRGELEHSIIDSAKILNFMERL